MNLVRWTRFTWNLESLPPRANLLGGSYVLRPATKEEEAVVESVILRAFSLDSDWADQFATFRERLRAQVRQAFERQSVGAVVILHGVRIVAASALSYEIETESHLISGPCVLPEYRNRGLGSALLYESLAHLAQHGLPRAHGIAKENVQAARFVYPKFGSSREPFEFHPAQLVC